MNCPRCQASNPPSASFCMKCGAALAAACPKCGTDMPPEAQFCYKCGSRLSETKTESQRTQIDRYIPKELLDKLESARSSGRMQGERRVVTMLFCDVQGSTAAAEKLDPEEWAEIMNGAFEHLIAPVYRYEGTLAPLMGDAILAFFGAPIAHEDDPQRAVLVGLDILQALLPYRQQVKEKWGLDFNVRVGINTGLVVVGEMGSDLRLQYTALGDAVNLAARMEQTAQPGTVQITEHTHKLVAPLFEFESLGEIQVKGKSQGIQAYRVLRSKAEPGQLRGIEGLDAPLIGRDKEMNILRTAIGNLCQGQGQILSVMGEAGLGKSRLIAELRKALRSEGLLSDAENQVGAARAKPTIAWYEGRSLSYQTSTPYASFVSLFTGYFGLREEADAKVYYKVRQRIAELLPEAVDETSPFVATLLGIDLASEELERTRYLQPPQLRQGVFSAIVRLVQAMAKAQPLVLVLEDLHWADSTSLDLLEQLMPITDRAALMIIGVFRPLRQEPSWRFHEIASRDYSQRYVAVVLEPLDEDNARTLVANLLHIEDLPEKVRSLILTKAEGNPFFVEEVVRSLLDARLVVRENSHWRATAEIQNIAVPDTLAGVIMARLDRLEEEPRRVVQTASVIGREFQFDLLADVYDAPQHLDYALSDLQKRELVREKSRLPKRVYTFKHALTQETAHGSLLISRRRELHRRVAECLERLDPERVIDIAQHYLGAGEQAHALPYLVAAGDRAAHAYSTPEATGFYTKALEILQTVQDLPLARRTYEGVGSVLTFKGDIPGAIANYEKMLEVAQAHADLPMQVSAMNKLGFVTALMLGQFPEGEKQLEEAQRLAHQCNDLPGLAETHMTYCYIRNPKGDFEGAIDHLKESARIGDDLHLAEPKLFGLNHTAMTLMAMTRFQESWKVAQQALQLAQELGNRQYQAELFTMTIPIHHLRNGDLEAARQAVEKGISIASPIGAAQAESIGLATLGQLSHMQGDYQRAIAHYQHALQVGQVAGMPFLIAGPLCALGTAYLDISPQNREQVIQYHAQALKLMEHPLGAVMGAMLWAEMGFCGLAVGQLQQASELFQRGLTVSTMAKYLARPLLLVGSAFVALAQSQQDEAARLVQEAREFAEERAMKHFYPMLAFAQAQGSAARGHMTEALDSFARCEGLAKEMQMRPLVWQAQAGAAQALYVAGHTSEAEEKLQQAQAMIDEIARLFQDQGLRAAFLENATERLKTLSGWKKEESSR